MLFKLRLDYLVVDRLGGADGFASGLFYSLMNGDGPKEGRREIAALFGTQVKVGSARRCFYKAMNTRRGLA